VAKLFKNANLRSSANTPYSIKDLSKDVAIKPALAA
jgi:hypothetical protein